RDFAKLFEQGLHSFWATEFTESTEPTRGAGRGWGCDRISFVIWTVFVLTIECAVTREGVGSRGGGVSYPWEKRNLAPTPDPVGFKLRIGIEAEPGNESRWSISD